MTHKGKLRKPKLWQSKRTEGTPDYANRVQRGNQEVSQSQEGKGKTGFSSSPLIPILLILLSSLPAS